MLKPATGSGPPSMSRQMCAVKVVKTREAPGPSPSMARQMRQMRRQRPKLRVTRRANDSDKSHENTCCNLEYWKNSKEKS